jgi:hypothetical protein
MYYFDILRAGRALKTYTIVLGSILLVMLVTTPFSRVSHSNESVTINGQSVSGALRGFVLIHQMGQTIHIPFSVLCAIAAFAGILFATGCATSLSRFNKNLHFTFTKPVSRERSTLTTIGTDALTIVAAFAIGLVFALAPIAIVGLLDRLTFDLQSLAVLVLGLGIAYMWYGIVQAATSVMRGGSGIVLGLSWAVFVVMQGLQHLSGDFVPPVFVWIIHTFNTINPFIVMNQMFETIGVADSAVFGPPYVQQLAIAYLTALVGVAIAVTLRKRMAV